MAVNPVTLAEMLRPWRAAGVTHFLADVLDSDAHSAPENDAARMHPTVSTQPAKSPVVTETISPSTIPTNSSVDDVPSPPPSMHVGPTASVRNHDTPIMSPRCDVPGAQQEADGAHMRTQPAGADALDTRNWPEAWQVIFSRTRSAPLVWTYPELGVDLSGRGSKDRSGCLRALIGALALPRGSSAFWPLCMQWPTGTAAFSASGDDPDSRNRATLPAKESIDTVRETEYFLAGIQLLTPKAIILLGNDSISLTGLSLTLQRPFTQQFHLGRLYVLLPGFDEFLKRPDLPQRACVFLRTAFAGLPALFSSVSEHSITDDA